MARARTENWRVSRRTGGRRAVEGFSGCCTRTNPFTFLSSRAPPLVVGVFSSPTLRHVERHDPEGKMVLSIIPSLFFSFHLCPRILVPVTFKVACFFFSTGNVNRYSGSPKIRPHGSPSSVAKERHSRRWLKPPDPEGS